MGKTDNSIIVESKAFSLKALFADKFTVDFYQREYVWTRKQIEDLIMDLSTEFLKQWEQGMRSRTYPGMILTSWARLCCPLRTGKRAP